MNALDTDIARLTALARDSRVSAADADAIDRVIARLEMRDVKVDGFDYGHLLKVAILLRETETKIDSPERKAMLHNFHDACTPRIVIGMAARIQQLEAVAEAAQEYRGAEANYEGSQALFTRTANELDRASARRYGEHRDQTRIKLDAALAAIPSAAPAKEEGDSLFKTYLPSWVKPKP